MSGEAHTVAPLTFSGAEVGAGSGSGSGSGAGSGAGLETDSVPRAGPIGGDDRAAVSLVRSEMLLGPARRLLIEHDGEFYVLRQTSRNRLILTK